MQIPQIPDVLDKHGPGAILWQSKVEVGPGWWVIHFASNKLSAAQTRSRAAKQFKHWAAQRLTNPCCQGDERLALETAKVHHTKRTDRAICVRFSLVRYPGSPVPVEFPAGR